MPQATVMAEPGPRSPRFPSSKFRAPKVVTGLVRRPRLLDQLDRGDQVRLALVVGPAGAGKTMLLADWLAARPERPSAWLSCDAADADPARFVAAIIEAARYGFGRSRIGEDACQLMSLDGEVSADAVATLADDLEAPDGVRVLVIDDFHLAGAASAEALRWLVEYHPPSLQLIVASRVDPPLRVHRMRANQDLVELRYADLAFSVEETRSLLAGFGVGLDEPELALVHSRSEGWVAGLQMAAISIHGSPDPATAAGRVQLRRHDRRRRTSWKRSSLSSRQRSPSSCWPPPSLTSFRCPPAPRCAARNQRRCSSSSTARTCSWRSWTTRPVPTAITT